MPSRSETSTITNTKSVFIQSQIRVLSTPLQPSSNWQESTTTATNSDSLSEAVVTDLLSKVNSKIRSHNRLVYSLPSQRHVAEQIDALYWNEIIAAQEQGDGESTWVERDADLTDIKVVKGLPEIIWKAKQGQVDDVGQYRELRATVISLVQRKDEIQRKIAGYRELRRLLEPFKHARENVQPNLVTKDGELARELERMRVLIARVTGGLGKDAEITEEGNVGRNHLSASLSEQQKLAKILDMG